MAGDSEQTLQNHQQPNGGEPFLIGVSGGTASGKVRRGRGAALPGPGRAAAHVARPRAVSVAAATAWPARLRSWPRSSAQSSPRLLRARRAGGRGFRSSGSRGDADHRAEGWRAPARSFFSAAVTRGPAPCGGLAGKADAYCFAGPTVGERAFGRVAGEPPMRPLPPAPLEVPGTQGGASREAGPGGLRERARRRPADGSPSWAEDCRDFWGKILSAN